MSVNIEAPSLKPPRVSLLSSADIISIPGDRWFGGIQARRLSGDPSTGHWGWNAAESPYEDDDVFVYPICPVDDQDPKTPFPRSDIHFHFPFAIYATDDCSTFGSGAVDFLDRAKQKLSVNEAWTVERMLWDLGGTFNNFAFVDSALTPLDTGAHPLDGFSQLDSAVADNRTDGRGMIHMTTEVFDLLQQYELFRREGNIWLSPLDNIVVPGRGYSGNGPADATATDTSVWMFGHPGIIQIARSEVVTFPETAEEVNRQMDRARNDIIVWAERVYAYIIQNGLGGDETDVFSVSVNPQLAYSGAGGGGGGDASAANQLDTIEAINDVITELGPLDTINTGVNPVIVSEPVSADETIASATALRGWSVWNTNAGISEVTIHVGNDSGDPVVARFRLAEDESHTIVFPVRIPTSGGIHFEVVSGTIEGTVYYEA